jgi:hypothetical protein
MAAAAVWQWRRRLGCWALFLGCFQVQRELQRVVPVGRLQVLLL